MPQSGPGTRVTRRPSETDAEFQARRAAAQGGPVSNPRVEAENQARIRQAEREGNDSGAEDFAEELPLVGAWFSGDDREREQNQAMADKEIAIAELEAKQGTYDDLTAEYTEGDIEAYQLDPDGSQAAHAAADPGSIKAQRNALAAMQDIYRNGGLTGADRQGIRASQAMNAQGMRGQNEAAMASMEERGLGNSGMSFLSRMSGNQSLANANAMSMANINMNAQQRALSAMQGAGNLSSGMRNSSYNEDFSNRGAADQWAQTAMHDRRTAYNDNIRIQNQQADENVAGHERVFGQQSVVTGQKTGNAQQNMQDSRDKEAADKAEQNGQINTVIDVATAPGTGEALNPTEDDPKNPRIR